MNVRAGLAVQPYVRPPADPASPPPASPRRAAPVAPPSPASPDVQIINRPLLSNNKHISALTRQCLLARSASATKTVSLQAVCHFQKSQLHHHATACACTLQHQLARSASATMPSLQTIRHCPKTEHNAALAPTMGSRSTTKTPSIRSQAMTQTPRTFAFQALGNCEPTARTEA